ncbi:MAG: Copper type ascorbate-dependent monooxygenase [Bacteroidetes bacterium]|jgi:hypothetical protein|nr:Copper type ascorbate-dependent monooxygenase [Bacteroidota bacterium]
MTKNIRIAILACFFISGFMKAQTPTWADDIAPILYNNCTSCHHTGGVAPNSLMTYNDAYNFRFMIKAYVESGYMPPWPPDPNYRHLAFERVISNSDKAKISSWALNNGPQGNTANAPTPPTYTNNSTQLSSVDFSAKMQDYVVNTSSDLYRCFVINTNFAQDMFASEIEVKPGDPSIVHHVLVFEDTTATIKTKDSSDVGAGYTSFFGTGSSDSKLVGEWVPGTAPIKFPTNMGVRLRKNTRIVLQIHYPAGTFLKLDSTRINIKFAPSSPREVFLAPILSESNITNGPFTIPANTVKTFKQQYTNTYPVPFTILSTAPHMHLIGKKYKVYGVSTTNDTLPIININNWDFKWQGVYSFRSPLKIDPGMKIFGETEYDNTSSNPNNPNSPPQQISYGESTTEEMMQTYFAFLLYQPGDENIIVDNSPIVGIKDNLKNEVVKSVQLYNVFPNPGKSVSKLSYYSPSEMPAKAKIISMEGKIMKDWPVTMHSGFGEISFNVEGMAKGQYFISIETKGYTKTKTFLINE